MAKPMSDTVDEYQVFRPGGRLVLGAPASCRYPKNIEQSILDAGYTIRLRGEKLTKNKSRRGDDDGKQMVRPQ